MKILILGANGSGKSAYAEQLAVRLAPGAPYYLATMIAAGAEGAARVEKHRAQRAKLGFITVETPYGVSGQTVPPGAVALLEDVSNLLANAMFGAKPGGDEHSVFADIASLCGHSRAAVLVSISGLSADIAYDAATCEYIAALNRLNSQLAEFADTVIELRQGQPLLVKGELDEDI